MIRSWTLAVFLLALTGSAGSADDPPSLDRELTWSVPRCSLASALSVLSEASGVKLTVSPELAELQLVGHVPKRPAREFMDAVAELFDARWTPNDGGFRLVPIPEKARAARAARQSYLAKLRSVLDAESADALREAKGANPPDESPTRARTRKFGMLLWAVLPAEQRDKVLRGTSFTLSLPIGKATPVYKMLLALTEKDNQPLIQPPLITYDLDEKGENMLPQLRARMTARRKNSIIGAFGVLDLTSVLALPPISDNNTASPEDKKLPIGVGENGRFVGTRDELTSQVASGIGIPILSRQRALPDSTYGLNAANRPIGAVIDDLARQSDATGAVTRSGFRLLRSKTELIDSLYLPDSAVVARYLKVLPAPEKRIPFETVAQLATLSPIQLKVLQRSNTCAEAAEFAYDCYGLLRFYNTLTPAQKLKVFTSGKSVGESGLELAGLPYASVHALLDERTKRGDLNIYGELQDIAGLRLLFTQTLDQRENTFSSQALRNEVKSIAYRELAFVDEEARPTAK